MSDFTQRLTSTLHGHGFSLTKPRQELFAALQGQEPMSVDHLLTLLNQDRATMYRNINIFIESGVIQRLSTGWKYKLELSDEFSTHHHHATCERCGRIVVLKEEPGLEVMINTMALRSGFRPNSHQLELSGLCKECIKNDPRR